MVSVLLLAHVCTRVVLVLLFGRPSGSRVATVVAEEHAMLGDAMVRKWPRRASSEGFSQPCRRPDVKMIECALRMLEWIRSHVDTVLNEGA